MYVVSFMILRVRRLEPADQRAAIAPEMVAAW
jgi:hypothetical protein